MFVVNFLWVIFEKLSLVSVSAFDTMAAIIILLLALNVYGGWKMMYRGDGSGNARCTANPTLFLSFFHSSY